MNEMPYKLIYYLLIFIAFLGCVLGIYSMRQGEPFQKFGLPLILGLVTYIIVFASRDRLKK